MICFTKLKVKMQSISYFPNLNYDQPKSLYTIFNRKINITLSHNVWNTFPFPLYCLKASECFFIPNRRCIWFPLLNREEFWWLSVGYYCCWQMVQMSDTFIVWCCLSDNHTAKFHWHSVWWRLVKSFQMKMTPWTKFTILVVQWTQGVPLCTLLVPSLFRHTTRSLPL